MNAAPFPPTSRFRWLGWVALFLAVQVAFIFWLGTRRPVTPPVGRSAPAIFLTGAAPATVDWDDPTLFALPNRNGFAGLGWALTPRLQYTNTEWTAPSPRWQEFSAAQLDTGLSLLAALTVVPPLVIAEKPAPVMTEIPGLPALDLLPEKSTLQITGSVAPRPLLTPLNLPDQPAADVLAPTEVRVIVGADGSVFSAVLLNSSRSTAADQQGLALARAARFAPLPEPASDPASPLAPLSWGRLRFTWRTVAAPAAPAAP